MSRFVMGMVMCKRPYLNTLYVPSYKQDMFSVQAATNRGATESFTPDNSKCISANGAEFDILLKAILLK